MRLPELEFVDQRLDNGLRLILHRCDRNPLAHVSLHYHVGSSYETPGLSGLAHLFEHMMFQGSENVAKNEHGARIDRAGGAWNASTGKDRTHYHETLPSHHLELALWLEADRMRSLAVTEENFENQRQTVLEEKKQSYDDRPYGAAHLRFDAFAYTNWAYGHPIIGSESDLHRATHQDALAFHTKFYGPGNATLVLTGDLEIGSAIDAVGRYFGEIPNLTSPSATDLSEPVQTAEKREVLQDPLARLPAISIGYHTAGMDSPDYYALSLLALILAQGDSSRFYRRFVYERNWLADLYVYLTPSRGPGLFRMWLQLQQGVDMDQALTAIDEEIALSTSSEVSDEELEKARNQVMFRALSRLERIAQIGESLAQATSLLGDPEMAFGQFQKLLEVTPGQIRETAQRTLTPANRAVQLVEPSGGRGGL